jgi:hypothetical protein
MTPSHANKKGIRYRYYVSQAILQNRESEAGSVTRVSAPDVEDLVVKAIRERAAKDEAANATGQMPSGNQGKSETVSERDLPDRILVLEHVAKIVIQKEGLLVHLRSDATASLEEEPAARSSKDVAEWAAEFVESRDGTNQLSIPFKPNRPLRKGVVPYRGTEQTKIDATTRETLLLAIAKSQAWVESARHGDVPSFADIAREQQISERYVRRLAQLAFLSPKIVEAIDNGMAPAGLTVSSLTQSLPVDWTEQERMFGVD